MIIKYITICPGTYHSKDGRISIDRNEGIDEWSLRVDGHWIDYYPTLRKAKDEALSWI